MKWRNVKDKLPGEYTNVLTLSVFPNGNFAMGVGYYHTEEQKWQIDWSDDVGGYEDITYWMPLPRPPKYMECIVAKCTEMGRAWNKYCAFHANVPLERGF